MPGRTRVVHLSVMNPKDASRSRRLVILVAAATVVLLLVGVGVYGLITGPRTPDPPATTTPLQASPDPVPAPVELAPIRETDDPEQFARAVAGTLFTWDTASGLMPLDYTSVLLDVADPTGEEQAGLASDMTGYYPAREAWLELRKYATTQHLEITDAYVPEAWETAEAQAQARQLLPGTTAYTIEGIRHRTGIWNDEPVTSEHQVGFTIFLTCPPNGDPCYLLRLSILDQPLR